MKTLLALLGSAALTLFASAASAQAAQGSWSTQGGYSGSQSGFPGQTKPIENIGRSGQFIFGVERLTGVFLDRQAITYTDQATGEDFEHTFKGTTLALLGVSSANPSSIPRFALDYVVMSGLTVGGSVMLSTHGVSTDGEGGQRPAAPPTAGSDSTTWLAAVRAGYAFAFDKTFAVWPRAGLGYAVQNADVASLDAETGLPGPTFQHSVRFGSLNLELLGALSPIEHIVLLAGPYLDLGIGGRYSVEDAAGSEIDRRGASLTSFGLLVHAAGYY